MLTSTLTRAATAAALAATAGLAVAGTASAATPVKPLIKTVLSITAAKDVISGKLTAKQVPLAKEVVTLDTVAGKKLTVVAKAVTGKAGTVIFKIDPKAATKYELVFKGINKLSASHSAIVTIKVAKPKA